MDQHHCGSASLWISIIVDQHHCGSWNMLCELTLLTFYYSLKPRFEFLAFEISYNSITVDMNFMTDTLMNTTIISIIINVAITIFQFLPIMIRAKYNKVLKYGL
ncbi:hypothetical protein BD560DRAFT_428823 [Blakeslea trispora]|nr:hypothetical protein BD560DRAFT_428823 [Blakeslea trispora]